MVAASAGLPAGSSIHATLHEMGRAYRVYAHEHPELFGLVFGGKAMHGQTPDGDGAAERPGFDELVAAIARGMAAGEIDSPAAEPVAVAVACWSLVHGFVVLEMAGHFGPRGTGVADDAGPDAIGDLRGGSPATDGLFELVLDRMLLGVLTRDR